MVITKKHTSIFLDVLRNIFETSDINEMIENKGISPISIYLLSESTQKWNEIPNWKDFEENIYEYNNQEENDIFLHGVKKDQAILVSDTSLLKKECLFFDVCFFDEFKIEYSDIYQCEFFQPEDYIIFFTRLNYFTLIHNSGKVVYLKLNEEGKSIK